MLNILCVLAFGVSSHLVMGWVYGEPFGSDAHILQMYPKGVFSIGFGCHDDSVSWCRREAD